MNDAAPSVWVRLSKGGKDLAWRAAKTALALFSWAVLAFASVFMLLALVTMLLFGTATGSQILFDSAVELTEGRLAFESVEGTLVSGLNLRGLEVHLPSGRVQADQLDFRWQPALLFIGVVSIGELRVGGVDYFPSEAEPSQTEPESNSIYAGEWPTITLPLWLRVGEFQLDNIRLVEGYENATISGSLQAFGRWLELADLRVETPDILLDLSGSLRMTPPYALDLHSDWRIGSEIDVQAAGTTSVQGSLAELTLDNWLSLPAEIITRGTLRTDWPVIDLADLRIDLVNQVQHYQVEVPDVGLLTFSNGTLDTVGVWGELALSARADVALDRSAGPVSGSFTADGLVGVSDISGLTLALETDIGALNLVGDLGWQDGFQWQAAVELRGFSTSALAIESLEDLGIVDLSAQTSGALIDGTLTLEADEINLTGSYANNPVSLVGGLTYAPNLVEARDIEIEFGDQLVLANGQIFPQPSLQILIPEGERVRVSDELQLDLSGELTLDGTWDNPRLQAALSIREVQFGDYRIEDLRLAAAPAERPDGTFQHEFKILGSGLSSPQLEMHTLEANGFASVSATRFSSASVDLRAGFGDADLSLAMGWSRQPDGTAEEIRVQHLSLVSTGFLPNIELTEPALATRDLAGMDLPRLCFEVLGGYLCANASLLDGAFSVQADLESLQAARLQRWVPVELGWQANISGHLSASGENLELTQADFELRSDTGVIQPVPGQELEGLTYSQFVVGGNFDGDTWRLDASADLPEDSQLRGAATIEPESGEISADFTLNLSYLGWLEGVTTRVENPSGVGLLQVGLRGQLPNPELTMELRVSDFEAVLVDSGTQLQASSVHLEPTGAGTYRISGQLGTPSGVVDLAGNLQIPDLRTRPTMQLTLTGKDFQIANRPDVSARINPTLALLLHRQGGSVHGLIEVPSAAVRLPDLAPTTIRRSPDEIISGVEVEEAEGGRFSGRVRVVIGDDVQLTGRGLTTRVAGALDAVYGEDGSILLFGTVTVTDGEYTTYGRTLTIESGTLTFNGDAADPGISLRATQSHTDYEVGIQITGTASNPQTTLFSSPDMPQSDILSVLVTGRRLDRITEGEAPSLLEAIDTLGIAGGESLSSRVQQAFGLSEFRIVDEGGEAGESVVLGKYILPRLYVELIQSLFARTSTLGLEYLITDNLRLRARSGDAQSMGLIYVIERP